MHGEGLNAGEMAQADPGPDPEAGLARLTELLAPFPAAAVRRAPEKGRFLVAAADLGHGETVLRGHSYATAVLGSHVKRVCAHCMEDFERRLEICCKDCQQVYYCSEACRERHRTGYRRQSGRSRSCVPHRLTCPVLGPFASGRFDTEMESVLRLLVDVYALRYLEEHVGDLDWEPTPLADGEGTEGTDGAAGPRGEEEERLAGALGGLALADRAPVTFTHADFLDLQTHAADLSGPQKKEFVKPLRFMAKAFARAEGAWPGFTAPPKEEMVDWASRIDSNCFGLFLDKDHKREPELAGREVYLLASLMNHSCIPNCEIDVNRTHFELKAREAIPAGTELTVSAAAPGRGGGGAED